MHTFDLFEDEFAPAGNESAHDTRSVAHHAMMHVVQDEDELDEWGVIKPKNFDIGSSVVHPFLGPCTIVRPVYGSKIDKYLVRCNRSGEEFQVEAHKLISHGLREAANAAQQAAIAINMKKKHKKPKSSDSITEATPTVVDPNMQTDPAERAKMIKQLQQAQTNVSKIKSAGVTLPASTAQASQSSVTQANNPLANPATGQNMDSNTKKLAGVLGSEIEKLIATGDSNSVGQVANAIKSAKQSAGTLSEDFSTDDLPTLEKYVADAQRQLKTMRDSEQKRITQLKLDHVRQLIQDIKSRPVRAIHEEFNSVEELIYHFLSQGKTRQQALAAWSRGYRGPNPKKARAQAPIKKSSWLPYVDEQDLMKGSDLDISIEKIKDMDEANEPKKQQKTRTKDRTQQSFGDYQAPADNPLQSTDPLDDLKKKAGVGDTKINIRKASRGQTLSATRRITPTDDMANMLGRIRNINIDPSLDPYPNGREEPDLMPSVDVTTANLPAVVGNALQAAGVQTPDFHQLANLPGNMAAMIRQLGVHLFGSMTMTPTKRIYMIANLGGQGPNTNGEVQAVANFLKEHGKDRGPGDIDFDAVMPGYTADTHIYTAAGIRWLLVRDFAGQYIYCWPEGDSYDAAARLTQ
jgi:RNA polymerase-interacting CarD/CdnL/TRCF family regulator